jgi:cytochrome c-type biogenesis protein
MPGHPDGGPAGWWAGAGTGREVGWAHPARAGRARTLDGRTVSIGSLVSSGPLILAVPVAAAAGAVTFLSPCCLPLVPGYLSYVTGMSGAGAARSGDSQAGAETASARLAGAQAVGVQAGGARLAAAAVAPAGVSGPSVDVPAAPPRSRVVVGTALFVLGFSVLYTSYGLAFGGLGTALRAHQQVLTQVLGALTIVLGLLFAGLLDRFTLAGRIIRPSLRPRAGLAGAPLLGVLFGLGWSPCIGPTLTAVLTLAETSGTAVRGAFLAFVYCLGLGIPFLIVALAFQRGMRAFGFARRHARLITGVGGGMLVLVGVLEVTGAWSAAIIWLQVHWVQGYSAPI